MESYYSKQKRKVKKPNAKWLALMGELKKEAETIEDEFIVDYITEI